jgi:hypothetical protein
MYRGLITLSIVYWYGVFRATNITNYITSKIMKTKQKKRSNKDEPMVSYKYKTVLYRSLKSDKISPFKLNEP